jgi:hypothetical protein
MVHRAQIDATSEKHINLTPRNRTLLEKPVSSRVDKKYPRITWNLKVHYRVYKSPPLVPIVSQLNPINVLSFCFFKVVLIISSHLYSITGCLVRFSHRSPRNHVTPPPVRATFLAHFILILEAHRTHKSTLCVEMVSLYI